MKIEESRVNLDARHEYAFQRHAESVGEISFKTALNNTAPPASLAALDAPRGDPGAEPSPLRLHRLLQQLLDAILALLSGQACRPPCPDLAALRQNLPPAGARPTRVIEWQGTRRERIDEHERTEIRAQGEVRTADGRRIAFDLSLDLRRDYTAISEVSVSRRIELKDPLVINFAGQAATLSGQRIAFDLDADGTPEQVPTLADGCGYLAFDADGDGRIADGRELFGATGAHTGDGFADLARHDADQNGWIDEADPAWCALGVWFPDGPLKPLAEAGIGAIGLASTWSPFALKDNANAPLGQITRTGVFLSEDGSAGTVQQVDLATSPD